MFSVSCMTVDPLEPAEVEKLREIVRGWCAEYGCDPGGKLAQDRARKILLAYAAGIRDTGKLLSLVRPF